MKNKKKNLLSLKNLKKRSAKKSAALTKKVSNHNMYSPSKDQLRFVPSCVQKYCKLTDVEVDTLCAAFESNYPFGNVDAKVGVVITPELAEALLRKLNTVNRKASTSQIKTYASRMSRKVWLENGPRLIFSKSKNLINSQHTLAAIILSGLSQEVLVQTGVPDEFANILDNDKSRSVKDAAVIQIKQHQLSVGMSTELTKQQQKMIAAAGNIASKLISGLHPNEEGKNMTPFDKAAIGNQNIELFGTIHEQVSKVVEGLNIEGLSGQKVQLESAFAWHGLNNKQGVLNLLEELVSDPHHLKKPSPGGGATSPWKKFVNWYKDAPKADKRGTGRIYSMALSAIDKELTSPGTNIKTLHGWKQESLFNTKNNFPDLWEPQYPLPKNWKDYF